MGRAAAAFSGDGGAGVYSAMDVRVLAGLGVPRGLFRSICRDHALSDQTRSAASGATDERWSGGREAAGAKDHHVAYVAGICGAARHPGAGSALRVVSHAALGCARRRRPGRARLPRRVFRVSAKQLHFRDHRIGAGPKGHFDRALRAGAPSDVRRSSRHASRHTDCARLDVGVAGFRCHSAGAAMEAV